MNDFERGFLIGSTADASVYQRKKGEYIIEWEQKNREWLEKIKEIAGKGRIRKTSAGYWRLVIYSKKIYMDHYLTFSEIEKILQASIEFKKGFIRGLFDAEGSVHASRFQIRIFCCIEEILEIVSKILKEDFGIKSTVSRATKNEFSDVFALCIYSKREIRKFLEKIGSFHPEKVKKLKKLLRSP